MTPEQLLSDPERLSIVGLLLAFGWLMVTERLVPGSRYQRSEARGERLLEMLLQALGHGDKALEMTDRVLRKDS